MDKILTYFSHSYRLPDQEINKDFWSLFGKENFELAVDPPSSNWVSPYLEKMMNRSSCFVAVVNYRDEERTFHCSRFILYEYGLALQAGRPFLLLIDDQITNDIFKEVNENFILEFDRNDPLANLDDIQHKIRELKKRALPISRRGRGDIGLLATGKSTGLSDPKTMERIQSLCQASGFGWQLIQLPFVHNANLANTLSKCEFVLVDIRGQDVPEWAFAYIYGRLIPSMKLAHLDPDEHMDEIDLPPMIKGLKIDDAQSSVESVTFWRDNDELLHEIGQTLKKFKLNETQFHGLDAGLRYFDSIGRRGEAKVFISSANTQIELALKIAEQLNVNNIDTFYYKETDAIETGSDWQKQIQFELETSNIFVALIDDSYLNSTWCITELLFARTRGNYEVIFPYQLDNSSLDILEETQAADLRKGSEQERVDRIFKQINVWLKPNQPEASARREVLDSGSKRILVDQIRLLAPSHRDNVLNALDKIGVRIKSEDYPKEEAERLVNQHAPNHRDDVLNALRKIGVRIKSEDYSKEEAEQLIWAVQHADYSRKDPSTSGLKELIGLLAKYGKDSDKQDLRPVKKQLGFQL